MTPGLTESGCYEGRIRSSHVRRKAIVYVRQSTPGQVERHRESTALQYGLTNRAHQLGWAGVCTPRSLTMILAVPPARRESVRGS